jgi:hypothetical protein
MRSSPTFSDVRVSPSFLRTTDLLVGLDPKVQHLRGIGPKCDCNGLEFVGSVRQARQQSKAERRAAPFEKSRRNGYWLWMPAQPRLL